MIHSLFKQPQDLSLKEASRSDDRINKIVKSIKDYRAAYVLAKPFRGKDKFHSQIRISHNNIWKVSLEDVWITSGRISSLAVPGSGFESNSLVECLELLLAFVRNKIILVNG